MNKSIFFLDEVYETYMKSNICWIPYDLEHLFCSLWWHNFELCTQCKPLLKVVSCQMPSYYLLFFLCSGGQTWTADLTIMSRALLPTELRRQNYSSFEPSSGLEPEASSLPWKCSTNWAKRAIVPRVGFEPTKA